MVLPTQKYELSPAQSTLHEAAAQQGNAGMSNTVAVAGSQSGVDQGDLSSVSTTDPQGLNNRFHMSQRDAQNFQTSRSQRIADAIAGVDKQVMDQSRQEQAAQHYIQNEIAMALTANDMGGPSTQLGQITSQPGGIDKMVEDVAIQTRIRNSMPEDPSLAAFQNQRFA